MSKQNRKEIYAFRVDGDLYDVTYSYSVGADRLGIFELEAYARRDRAKIVLNNSMFGSEKPSFSSDLLA